MKLFPADTLGPRYVRSVLAPMPQLSIMPTGGVTPANAGEWLAAGCVAVGLGASLVDAATVDAGAWQVLQDRARTTTEAVSQHRAAHSPSGPAHRSGVA